VLGAPGELFRALEDIIEDQLFYKIIRDDESDYKRPDLQQTGIQNVAIFEGRFESGIRFETRNWAYIAAGAILGLIAVALTILALTERIPVPEFPFNLVVVAIGFGLFAGSILLFLRSLVEGYVKLRVTLEGEAYQSMVSRRSTKTGEEYSQKYAVLSRGRLKVEQLEEDLEAPKATARKVQRDIEGFREKVESVLPKFELGAIEVPESRP